MLRALLALVRPVPRDRQRCVTCAYWRPLDETCRAELPRVLTGAAPAAVLRGVQQEPQVKVVTFWPPTAPGEWCGHWRRR